MVPAILSAVMKVASASQIVTPADCVLADRRDIGFRSVQHQPAPIAVLQQEAGIALKVALDAEFDETLRYARALPDQPFDDAIFTPLRRDPKFRISERGKLRQRGDLAGRDLPLEERLTLDRRAAFNNA